MMSSLLYTLYERVCIDGGHQFLYRGEPGISTLREQSIFVLSIFETNKEKTPLGQIQSRMRLLRPIL